MERILKKNKKKKDKKISKAKVVIGIPCWSHLYEGTESSLYSLLSHPNVIGRVKSSGALVYETRNDIVKSAIEQFPDMTHLLFVDSDMTFGQHQLDLLLESKKDIISGVYCKRVYPFEPCFISKEEDYGGLLENLRVPVPKQKPFAVDGFGMGFALISKKVLIRKHWNSDELWFYPTKNKEGIPQGEDYSFCEMVKSQGYKLWVHPACQLGHQTEYIVTLRDWIYTREGTNEQDKPEE